MLRRRQHLSMRRQRRLHLGAVSSHSGSVVFAPRAGAAKRLAHPGLVYYSVQYSCSNGGFFTPLKLQMRALQRPCTQILLHQSCYSFEKMSQVFSEMQSLMFDPKSRCVTHPASIWRPIAACACTHLDTRHSTTLVLVPICTPPSVLMMHPFQECPRDRRCDASRRGGRAHRRRTMALRRDCGWLMCGAEVKGGRLGEFEETLAIQIGQRVGATFGQRAFSRAYRA